MMPSPSWSIAELLSAARMFGPIFIAYGPSSDCAVKVTLSVLFEFVHVKPEICGLRLVPPGPAKLTTSDATSKLAGFIGSSNVNVAVLTVGLVMAPVGVDVAT